MTASTPPPEPAPDAIRVSFTTSQAEQIAASRRILRMTTNWRVSMVLFGGLPIALAIRAGLTQGLSSDVFTLGLAAAVSLVFWNYGMAWLAVRAARRGVRSPDGPFTWTLDENGCRLEGPSVDVTLRWTAIVDTKETPETFLLYVSKMQAYAIPRRAVSDADLPRLRSLLARGVEPAAA
jgi:hypothetical protein